MKTGRKPVDEHWAAAQSKTASLVARAATGQSKKDGPHDLWPTTRDTMATLALVEAVVGLGWQLDGIRRLLATHDLTQEEVEFVERLRSAGITDYRDAFDAAAGRHDEAMG